MNKEASMTIKILGICGTPVKGETNTGYLIEMIMDNCKKQGDDIETEIIRLADKKITAGCIHCNWCLERQTKEKICAINDDWTNEIAPKVVEADALVWATPVYLMRMTWLLASNLDRHRAFGEGRYYGIRGPGMSRAHRYKPVLSAAVAWVAHGGVETTLQVLCQTAAFLEMLPVTGGFGLGVAGISAAPLGDLGAVRKDPAAISSAQIGSMRLVELTRILKAGKEALLRIPAYVEASI
jgi:multimeric flavodoxin WrbA